MKSLYETILNSTNSGKRAPLTVNYLLGLGWIRGEDFKTQILSPDRKHYFNKYDYDNIFYTPVYDWDFKYLCRIRTLEDFEHIMKYWKDAGERLYTKQQKTALKELLDYLGKGGYGRSKKK